MRCLLLALFVCITCCAYSQSGRQKEKKYSSLLWEIRGKGLQKPSYLFGTMHVSNKMVFHLSDSFYKAIRHADIVALETDPGTWQDDFSRYDLDGYAHYTRRREGYATPNDYLSIHAFKSYPYEKFLEEALSESPSLINSFLYRNQSEGTADFEEDTYLDLYIYQAGRKWNKKVCGVEHFDESMTLMREAYAAAARDASQRQRNFDVDREFSYARMEEAYRTGNLDLLDTINKLNSRSAAFDEKFLYRRNEIQAASIDSIIRSGAALFVGVGAAHLPGERGVIEILRRAGYSLRPIRMTERDSRHKEEMEKIRVPVTFSRQAAADGAFSVMLPGKLYQFGAVHPVMNQQQYADMANGSYYTVSRVVTNAGLWGHSAATVQRKLDSVLYENVPGKILSRKPIVRNGYAGLDITNRTRRGDYQRYHIFITPFEVLFFKMSGTGEYVINGPEAERFFSSIQLRELKGGWSSYTPEHGGFKAALPHQPVALQAPQWQFVAYDKAGATAYTISRLDVHNIRFVTEDSFDLGLMEESFASSENIDTTLWRRQIQFKGYAALDAAYRYKDGTGARARFIIRGPHYYMLLATGKVESGSVEEFFRSFAFQPFGYGAAYAQEDTALHFTVQSPVAIRKKEKLQMYPDEMTMIATGAKDVSLEEKGSYQDRLIESDSTGEKIYVSFYKPSRYYYEQDTAAADTLRFQTDEQDWIYRSRKKTVWPNGMRVLEYELGDPVSSRIVRGKSFARNGMQYRILTLTDTLSKPGAFISRFFETFTPVDTISGADPAQKKADVFFADFWSSDSTSHQRAVQNVEQLHFDAADLPQLRRAINALNWSEKKYTSAKSSFIASLAKISSKESADYLKELYKNAGDTLEFQYAALNALLKTGTIYSYKVFRDIMVEDPPVLFGNFGKRTVVVSRDREYFRDSDFLDALTDSLELTKTIFSDLLPLININDYEAPLTDLLQAMVDSGLVKGSEYKAYYTKFLLEARQELKKQVIREMSRSIEAAQADEEDGEDSDADDRDFGNGSLLSYATLLMPFWNEGDAVPQFFQQLLGSNDRRLKYGTALLMLRNGKPLPDTLLSYFAGLDAYRHELFMDLKKQKQLQLFPAAATDPVLLARSELAGLGGYITPDMLAYLSKLPVSFRDRKGYVYFFKYRKGREDNGWKIATVGMIAEPGYTYEKELSLKAENAFTFTELTDARLDPTAPLEPQLQKVLKRKLYSKRKSAAYFYDDDEY